MRTLFLLSFCIFYINHKIPAQSDSLDSLNTEINQNLNAGNPRMLQRLLHTGLKITDSLDMLERNIKYRYFLGASYFGIDLDSGLAILKSAYEEAGKLENPINKMLIASQLATFYRESGNYSASLRYLQICIEILDQQEDGDQLRRALSNYNLQQAK